MTESTIRDLLHSFELFYASAPGGAALYGPSGDCLAANEALANLIGTSVENTMSQNYFRIGSWKTSGLLEAATKSATSGKVQTLEVSVMTTYQKKISIELTFVPFEVGVGTYLLMTVNDLTKRRNLEQQQQLVSDELRLYMKMVSTTNEAMSFVDVNYKYLAVNDSFLVQFDLQRENVIGYTVAEVLGEDLFLNRGKPLIDACLRGEVVRFEGWINLPKRRRRFAQVRSSPYREPNGVIAGVVTISHDATDARNSKEALSKSETEYKSTLNNLGIGVVVHSHDTSILFSNPEARRILGLSEQQLLGKQAVDPAWRFIHENFEPMKKEDFPVSLVLKNRQKLENYVIGVESPSFDELRWASVNAIPMFSKENQIEKIIINFVDITNVKILEKQLHQSEKMQSIGQLAGGIAHDFNNQLAGICGYADLLKSDLSHDLQLAKYAENIIIATERAAGLTGQLLAFAKKGQYRAIPIDIHKIIYEVSDILSHTISKNIEIKKVLKTENPIVVGDPSQLQNVILNLALNARDALNETGEIVFQTGEVTLDEHFCQKNPHNLEPGQYIKISVIDNGAGIDPNIVHRIFEPFFSTKKQGEGIGMGLASVYGTVGNHGGFVDVTSALSKGTEVSFFLKQSKSPNVHSSPPLQGDGEFCGISILIADDDATVMSVCKAMLETMNHRAKGCADGVEAVEYYKSHWKEIDIVILDMKMPRMGGRQAYKEMKKINPNIIALISTGYSIDDDAQNILNDGVNGFIQKPFRRAKLSEKIDALYKLRKDSNTKV